MYVIQPLPSPSHYHGPGGPPRCQTSGCREPAAWEIIDSPPGPDIRQFVCVDCWEKVVQTGAAFRVA